MKVLSVVLLALVCLWGIPSSGAPGASPSTGNTGGAGGTSYDGTTIYPKDTTADFCVGGTAVSTPAAEFCVDGTTHNVTTDGSITATEGFIVPPATTGGGISLSECENSGSCPITDAGNSLTIKLPDDADPLNGDRAIVPGWDMEWATRSADWSGWLDGTYCVATGRTSSLAQVCTTEVSSTTFSGWAQGLYDDSIWIDKCVVFVASGDEAGWDANDDLVLQMQHSASGAAATDIGTVFHIIDDGDTCSGECMNVDDILGTWNVKARAPSAGWVKVQIDDTTNNAGANALPLRLFMRCVFF